MQPLQRAVREYSPSSFKYPEAEHRDEVGYVK